MQSYRISSGVADRSPSKQKDQFQGGYRESEVHRNMATFPKPEDSRDGVSRSQFPNFPSFRDFGNTSTSSGTVVVDVLPPLYTQSDLVSHARDKMLDSPDEDRESPLLDKNSKIELKGKYFC